MGPRLSKNNSICFLGSALGVFLWVTLLLPFTDTSVTANNLDELPTFLLSVVLVGAPPLAAFPAILFYGGSGGKHGELNRQKYPVILLAIVRLA